ncbi:transmembrane protein 97 [Plakobranchus ocellatus]|uniref:Sigma intracellular receptor 2 n=1 Tax=Plakobranchus ocellatus TaxID=259542 RepID=A0AAV4DUP1_9GAST|nr:transmembrane protein 97 [Plakobranchus ocellatus]
MGLARRFLDLLFFFYFFTHIPIALLFDAQSVFPAHFFPKQLTSIREWYCHEYRDAMMADPPPWFQSLVMCELFLQFPFFFIASYGFFKGARTCKWLRWPCLVYGTHVATTLIPIIANVFLQDFSSSKVPGPRNLNERLRLISFYTPYFVIPVILVLDSLFSPVYTETRKQESKSSTKKLK